jgi:predicted acyltransferase
MTNNLTRGATDRLISLDVFRGLTIAGMVLVNNPGSWNHIYWPLAHAEWHGWTPTDLIFPFFLFIVGVAIPLAFGRRVDAGGTQRDL